MSDTRQTREAPSRGEPSKSTIRGLFLPPKIQMGQPRQIATGCLAACRDAGGHDRAFSSTDQHLLQLDVFAHALLVALPNTGQLPCLVFRLS